MGEVINLQQLRLEVGMGRAQPKLPVLRSTTTQDIVSKNTGYFWRTNDWKQKMPRGRTIENVVENTVDPRLSTLDLIAERAGIPAWYLMLPMPEELLQDHGLAKLVAAYMRANEDGRQAILGVATAISK